MTDTIERLQLTYIPAQYWNESISDFSLDSKKKTIPENASFFLIWIPLNQSEAELIRQIKYFFPNIPAEKLLTCHIRLALPLELLNINDSALDKEKYYGIHQVLGKIMPISPAIRMLFQLKIIQKKDYNHKREDFSESIKLWAFLTKFLFELLNRGNFIPLLKVKTEKCYKGWWKLTLKTQQDNLRLTTILNNSSWAAFSIPINFIPFESQKKALISYITDGIWHKSYIVSDFMDNLGDSLIRSALNKSKILNFEEIYSSEIKKEKTLGYKLNWDYKYLKSLIYKKNDFKIERFSETIIPNIIKNWVQTAQGFIIDKGFSLVLELKYPKNPNEDWTLNYHAQLLEKSSKIVPLKNIWKDDKIEIILRALGTAAKIYPPIYRSLEGIIPLEVNLNTSEVIDFLRYPKDLLIQCGFRVVIPEEFTQKGKQRLTARMIIHSSTEKKAKGVSSTLPSMFNKNSMLDYKWEATLEDSELDEVELKELIKSDEPLVEWRGKWIFIDQQDVKDLKTIFEKEGKSGKKSYIEALKLGLTGNIQHQESGRKYEVLIEGDFREIVEDLKKVDTFKEISTPKSFNGILRPYQKTALTWMGNMCAYNFGLCLADDMGLGKTIQVISYLLYLKEINSNDSSSILIICPTSVLFNWMREINKFAPDLDVILHHGHNRVKNASGIKKYLTPHKIILTTFGTIRNDIDFLQTIPFSGVIIDESQNIKNFSSKQTQAVIKLQSQFRICLSGTPIENHLIELWTLFEFLNPGLLETRAEFQKNYILPIERFQDQEAIDKLKLIISPFLMRRVKSDKSIISDLPDKNEMKIFIELSEVQKTLYKELVDKTLKDIETDSSDKRKARGLILKLLMQLKQLCNHPNQLLKIKDIGSDIKEFLSKSQKMERLLEMTDEVISAGGKILIFTQFRQMGDLIKKVLELTYPFEILYFHGGVPEKKRREIVDEFQSNDNESPPILILSLKAGGTGLNLTQGSTVIHFDRWWNPAVEDQATDRAYRIGQESQVNVYKFISIGTIEEKIDVLLEEKRDLADKIVASTGESWISNLSLEKLNELFSYSI